MFEPKTRLIAPVLLLAAGLALNGCSASKDGPKYPQPLPTDAIAKFNITTGALPYPIDLFFNPSPAAPLPDGTINLPTVPFRSAATQAAVNSLDGWSTSATLDTSFSIPVDASSISASTVKIIKIWVNPQNKGPVDPTDPNQVAQFLPAGATSPVAGVLEYGVDYTAGLSEAYDAGGKILTITPLKPFAASKGPAANSGLDAGKVLNVGYIVVLTNGLKSTGGTAFAADSLYSSLKSANCASLTDATQQKLCALIHAQLGIAQLATGTDPASVILSWSFSTQSVDDVLDVVTLLAQPQQTLIVPTGLKTSDAYAALPGHADIFVGSTKLPYYLTPASSTSDKAAVQNSYWTAATGPNPLLGLDPDSRNLTMFNPVPLQVATVTVPILVTIPNANSACATGMPAGGWPVAIVQHGIGGDRSQALSMADSFADACFVVVAMDMPLHGITDTTSPLYCTPAKPQCIGAAERTFDVDFVNNTTGASVPDGKPDASGSYFINLTSLRTQRDNLRQSEADLITLTKSLAAANNLVIPPNPAVPAGAVVPVDATRISFVGLSLGGIVGGSHLHFSPETRTATLAAPGGVITKLLLDSDYFGPLVRAGINSSGATPGSYVAELFARDAQAVIDSGDPINHIYDAGQAHPLHLMKVLNDTVVPNNSTDRLIVAGGLTKLTTLGPNPVGPGTPAYTFFSKGYHGSLFDPTVTSPETTVEMQKEAVKFAASAVLPGGPFVVLEDPTVLDLN